MYALAGSPDVGAKLVFAPVFGETSEHEVHTNDRRTRFAPSAHDLLRILPTTPVTGVRVDATEGPAMKGKDLIKLGFKPGPAVGVALLLIPKAEQALGHEAVLRELKAVLDDPVHNATHPYFAELAQVLREEIGAAGVRRAAGSRRRTRSGAKGWRRRRSTR